MATKDTEPLINCIKINKIPVQNIVCRLRDREQNATKSSSFHNSRKLYQNICPNFSCINVEKPACFIRKFTPDGSHLITFSSDQTSIEIYEYQGAAAANHLIHDWPLADGEDFTKEGVNNVKLSEIRASMFKCLFKLKHSIHVTVENEQLNRECSLFTDDSNYVIVASASLVPDESQLHYFEVYRNNESITLNSGLQLENYTIYLIDIKNGRCCDKRTFKTDRIILSHNQGLHLFKKTLAILSVQHQMIHLLYVTVDPLSGHGQFYDVKNIGRFCYEDDDYLVSSVETLHPRQQPRTFREIPFSGMKHRLLVHLLLKAKMECTPESTMPLQRFYLNFGRYCSLKMWKMQLLDESHLLIKYAPEDVITNQKDQVSPSFLVVFNFNTTHVIAAYDSSSSAFLDLFERYGDYLRNAHLTSPSQLACSPSNNTYSKIAQQRLKKQMINARNGGYLETVKRLLAAIPIPCQSFCPSPYLDMALFSYEEKYISVLERPKVCCDHPLRFFDRDSGFLRFKIHPGLKQDFVNPPNGARRLVAYTFHPTDPLVISVQRTNSEYVVNIHLRHELA